MNDFPINSSKWRTSRILLLGNELQDDTEILSEDGLLETNDLLIFAVSAKSSNIFIVHCIGFDSAFSSPSSWFCSFSKMRKLMMTAKKVHRCQQVWQFIQHKSWIVFFTLWNLQLTLFILWLFLNLCNFLKKNIMQQVHFIQKLVDLMAMRLSKMLLFM